MKIAKCLYLPKESNTFYLLAICMIMQRLRYALALFAAAGSAVARPSLINFGSMSMNNIFGRETTVFFNPDDLTFIKKLAAVGDSYSAGIGAGDGLHGEGGKFIILGCCSEI